MAWTKLPNPKIHRRSQVMLAVALAIFLVLVGGFLWQVTRQEAAVTVETTEIAVQQGTSPEIVEEQEETQPPEFDAARLQTVLEQWDASVSGQASVVVSDSDSNSIYATLQPDRQYFAASIYKLYVAYEGYRQVDRGDVVADEVYLNGFTRQECLDKMIRESDSPCAEKLWNELGKQELNSILQGYGIVNTDMVSITTTARDAAIMLSRIAQSEGLSAQSQQLFLESMRTQVFRDALNNGFSEDIIVYNKIGFNEQSEYHDTALVQLADGRQLIVSVMTDGVGTRSISQLAEQIEAAISS